MFRIKIERTRGSNIPQAAADSRGYSAGLQQTLATPYYYQIYEGGLPLMGMQFRTRGEARSELKGLVLRLQSASQGWYRVERILPHLPVMSTVGVRKIYANGAAVKCIYVVRRVDLNGGTQR